MKKTARKKKEVVKFEKREESVPIVAEVKIDNTQKRGLMKIFKNKPLLVGIIVVLVIIIAAGGFYVFSYFAEDAPQKVKGSEDVQKLIGEVGKIVALPQGEVPTIATVTDVVKLSTQPFFKNAANGDKVLIFGTSKQAILYRPTLRKIINMSPIDQNSLSQNQNSEATASATSPTNQPTVSQAPEKKLKVAIMNSTKEAGLAKKAGEMLDSKSYEVISTLNAKGEYEKTSISVVNKTVSDSMVNGIVSTFSKVTTSKIPLPKDEQSPEDADVVVILGSDFSSAY